MGSPAAPRRSLAALLVGAALALGASAAAEEVTTRHRGLTLNGNLEVAAGRSLVDGVVLITHGLLAHNGMELIAALQDLLKARGLSSLAINLSFGIDNRHGFFDCGRLHHHAPADALDEIEAWLGWLQAQGATSVVLMGHSQGGAQTALFAAERAPRGVDAVILLAPATYSAERAAAAYRQRFDAELAPVLERAQALVREGRGEQPVDRIGFLSCENATATAASIAAWYSPSPQRHTPALLPRIRQRSLVVVAGGDQVVPDLLDAVRPLDGANAISVAVVDGADHFFLDLYADEAADVIATWLRR